MERVCVDGWGDLQEELFDENWYAYRGASMEYDTKLQTSLRRLHEDGSDEDRFQTRLAWLREDGEYETRDDENGLALNDLENHLLRNFRRYARRHLDLESDWHLLSVAQHHGLPTRLLDWTYSPMVAAHFATSNVQRYDEPGVIWAVDAAEVNRRVPDPLRRKLDETGAHIFTSGMIASVTESRDRLQNLGEEPFPLFFEPPSLDDRIVNQFGLFSLPSDPELRLYDWLDDRRDLVRKIVIPADVKWEIRNVLDQSNVNERVLFPGLDGLSEWLKRYYHPDRPR